MVIDENVNNAFNSDDDEESVAEQEVINEYVQTIQANKFIDARLLFLNQRSIDLKNVTLSNGDNPLHSSVLSNNSTYTLFLLQHGVSPDVVNPKTNSTPMHYAIKNSAIKMITLLVQFNADTNIRNKRGETSKTLALISKNKEIKALVMGFDSKTVNKKKNEDDEEDEDDEDEYEDEEDEEDDEDDNDNEEEERQRQISIKKEKKKEKLKKKKKKKAKCEN